MKTGILKTGAAERRELILNGSIVRTLMMLSFPTLMMSVVQSLMPLSDGLFINNVAGTLVASAVTYSEPIINMMTALAQGLSVAAMAIIGQTFGQGNFKRVKHISTQTVVFAFCLGLCIAPLLVLIAFPISGHVDQEISHNVWLYIALYAMVLPFSFLESIYNAIMNATGRPEATFIRMVLMLVLKIIFNVVFIVWLRLGIVGCVMASLCANMLICIWMFYELFIQKGENQLTLKGFRFDGVLIHQLIRVGIPAMVTSLMLNFGFFLINNETQKYGPVVLNGQGIANNITSVCFNLPSSFGAAITTMVSMNVGAGEEMYSDRMRGKYDHGCPYYFHYSTGLVPFDDPVYAPAGCAGDRKSRVTYLHVFRRWFRNLHGSPGSVYRPRKDKGSAGGGAAANMAAPLPVYTGNGKLPRLLFRILGEFILQLYGGGNLHRPAASCKMEIRIAGK